MTTHNGEPVRFAAAIVIAIALTAAVSAAQAPREPRFLLEAWAGTNGPDGESWHLVVDETGNAAVSYWSGPGAAASERQFRLSEAARDAIVAAAREARFLDLPTSIGPEIIPVHGPEIVAHLTLNRRTRKVFLNEPKDAAGPDVERFRRVWQAVVAASPIKPPL